MRPAEGQVAAATWTVEQLRRRAEAGPVEARVAVRSHVRLGGPGRQARLPVRKRDQGLVDADHVFAQTAPQSRAGRRWAITGHRPAAVVARRRICKEHGYKFRFAADPRHPDDSAYADGLVLSDAHGCHWTDRELEKRPERSIVERSDAAGSIVRCAGTSRRPGEFAIEASLR
jgi:hypothetical protein